MTTKASTTTQENDALVRLRALRAGYGTAALTPPLETVFRRGEFWAFVGPNGCGKTTLLRTMLGLQSPVGGRVAWSPDTQRSYVAQRHRVAADAPVGVRDLVASAIDRDGSVFRPLWPRDAGPAVDAALARARATELGTRRFSTLSEGQKQRVFVARALVSQPDVLLLDEPSSAMDRDNERALFETLRELAESGLLVILVTHHIELVAAYASHVLLLDPEHPREVSGPTPEVGRDACCVRRYGQRIAEFAA